MFNPSHAHTSKHLLRMVLSLAPACTKVATPCHLGPCKQITIQVAKGTTPSDTQIMGGDICRCMHNMARARFETGSVLHPPSEGLGLTSPPSILVVFWVLKFENGHVGSGVGGALGCVGPTRAAAVRAVLVVTGAAGGAPCLDTVVRRPLHCELPGWAGDGECIVDVDGWLSGIGRVGRKGQNGGRGGQRNRHCSKKMRGEGPAMSGMLFMLVQKRTATHHHIVKSPGFLMM